MILGESSFWFRFLSRGGGGVAGPGGGGGVAGPGGGVVCLVLGGVPGPGGYPSMH